MSMIEGVGDEIIQFLGGLLVVTLGIVAWFSTRISDLPPIRTILIVERRSQNEAQQQSTNNDNRTVTNNLENNLNDGNPSVDNNDKNCVTTQSNDLCVNDSNQGTSDTVNNVTEQNNSIDSTKTETKNNDSSNIQEEANVNTDDSSTDNIRIRLKYLNDDQKLVEGRLQELLGDFKKRHFSVELSRQKRIRLIFNGQVLQRDEQTLQGYGLYDNCVVHCLIHAQQNTNRTNSQSHTNTSSTDWNLGLLLYASLSIVLGFAWFFRYHYSHLFTLTTTAALVSLTGMFAVSIIGMYMNEEEQVPS